MSLLIILCRVSKKQFCTGNEIFCVNYGDLEKEQLEKIVEHMLD